ncbi:MAG: hypothetical protein Q7S10_03105 [bacterium]|nr:hypothetical protein [bacterium]
MEEEGKKLILEAKNICIIPSQTNEPESLSAALALFYTLKELNKNVNLIIEAFPKKLDFLVPTVDFISEPKNFVISIPRSAADISQVYYEKNEDNLKIHLTTQKGRLKKEDVSFYFEDAKPDLVIALGIQDLQKELSTKLDSFGFLLTAPIMNVDNHDANTKFGKINMIETASLTEITLGIINSLGQNLLKENSATALLTGLIIHYENFKHSRTRAEAFAAASELIKKGANHPLIVEHVYKSTEQEIAFVANILKALQPAANGVQVAVLDSQDFEQFSEQEAGVAVEKIQMLGMHNDLLVLWKSHNSAASVKGFFYSKKPAAINKFSEYPHGTIKQGWVFLTLPGEDTSTAKNEIINLIQ